MFIKDSVDKAIILLGIKNKDNIFYFPNTIGLDQDIIISSSDRIDSINKYYGIFLTIDSRLTIEEQIVNTLIEKPFFKREYLKDLDIYEDFRVKLQINSEPVGMYLCSIKNTEIKIDPSWKNLSQILKIVPNNKNRIPYMFAMQYLATLKEDPVEAVEINKKDLNKYINS